MNGAVARTDWVCVGHACWRGDAPACAVSSRVLARLGDATTRVGIQRWVRYRIDLDNVSSPDADVELTPLSEVVVASLRTHPDYAQEAFASGLAFWDQGIRNGFVWYEESEPLCFQYLLHPADVAVLRARSPWANMYPPIPAGTGQLEKLWTFSTARKKGIASRFALAMFAEARRREMRSLITHIHEDNAAARSWAVRTGWQSYGTIVRYNFDLPVIRDLNLSVCEHRRDGDTSAGN